MMLLNMTFWCLTTKNFEEAWIVVLNGTLVYIEPRPCAFSFNIEF